MDNGKKQRSAVMVRERSRASALPELEHFLDRAFRAPWLWRRFWPTWPSLSHEAAWLPDMDVFEREGKTVVRVDLPGMKREDIAVAVEGDMLVIRGKREEAQEVKQQDYYCAERAVGEFSRAISLPEGVTADEIEGTYKDGVLEVVVPRPVVSPGTESVKVQVT